LAKNIYLPCASVDDLVGIFQSGAYGLTASPVGFLSHGTPAEILIDDRAPQVIRVRGSHQQELLFKV
jgi:diaminopimelate decarboxylase